MRARIHRAALFADFPKEYMADKVIAGHSDEYGDCYYFVGDGKDLVEYARQIKHDIVFYPKEAKNYRAEDEIVIYDDYIE